MSPSLGYFVTTAQTDKDRKSNKGQGPCQVGMMWREKTYAAWNPDSRDLGAAIYRGCLGKPASPGPIDFGMCGSLQVLLLERTPPSH